MAPAHVRCWARSGTAPPMPTATQRELDRRRAEAPTPPGSASTSPRDAETAYEVSVRLTPSSSGPSVSAGPVDQHALRDRPRLAHAPDRVERAVDRQHQRERGDHQHHQADDAEPARLGRELGQRGQHRLGDGVGHQALQEVLLQRLLEASRTSGTREQRQHHRHQRHQRDQRGEGQAAGGERRGGLRGSAARSVRSGVEPGPGAAACATAAATLRASSRVGARGRELMLAIMPAMTPRPPQPPRRARGVAAPTRASPRAGGGLLAPDRARPGVGAVAGAHRHAHAGAQGAAAAAAAGRAAALAPLHLPLAQPAGLAVRRRRRGARGQRPRHSARRWRALEVAALRSSLFAACAVHIRQRALRRAATAADMSADAARARCATCVGARTC